ncbi:hypothetical protein Daura_27100 [Dactylosporangium aurantiacum]|uniref:Uncharacterized protein n=1 Tax=Dactylosporangium aurantiacum TaxID=35754 RepID=A0A9Q9MC38_9ACTN|nr:hypothetical protein [Dactylosporangium aurantiacum]MDG6106466.1 hypothetical protein [Dactylosporangium aurantiacum]UWZ50499.1 hypothetical protein Daura_27100 [Dactylosporangium aurantiacum]
MTASLPDVADLTDPEAVRLLTLVADHGTALPDAGQLRQIGSRLREAAAVDEQPGPAAPVTAGDLARAALEYLAGSPEHRQVVARAASIPADGTRFEPATLAVGALVVIALQTEVKFSRDERGRWRLEVHKQAMRDSTLVSLITKLLDFSRQPAVPQQSTDRQLPPEDAAR